MSSYALDRRKLYHNLWVAAGWIISLTVIAAIAITVIWAIRNYQRGIYAGFHYGDARKVAINTMIVHYGKDLTSQMRFATPPVVNSHSSSLFVDGQIRIFHIIGPRGVRYCVSVWHPRDYYSGPNGTGINIGGETQIVVGCNFKT